MQDHFKYLTVGEEDTNWGLYLNASGSSTIKSGSIYPPKQHPSGYYFNYFSNMFKKKEGVNPSEFRKGRC